MRIGFLGLGAMGWPMVQNLLKSEHEIVVTAGSSKAEVAADGGAVLVDGVSQMAQGVELILCCLPIGDDVLKTMEQIVTTEKCTVKTVCDMSSIAPGEAQIIHDVARAAGIAYLDCPVSGGVKGAADGTLTIMVGGDETAFNLAKPYLAIIGNEQRIYHVGSSGMGSAVKMINNFLLGVNNAACTQAMVMGKKLGLDLTMMLDIINCSSGRSHVSENSMPPLLNNPTYEGGFACDLQYKDLGLSAATAQQLQMPWLMGSAAMQAYEMARAKGYGKQDCAAIVKVWEEFAGVSLND